jgi:hypothetical protein
MSTLFNKLPGFTSTPPGVERQILRRLPRALLIGSILLALPSLAVRFALLLVPEMATETLLPSVDIYAFSLLVLYWTVLFTAGLAAFIVMVMKGPAYVADAYPLSDADSPAHPAAHSPVERGNDRSQ